MASPLCPGYVMWLTKYSTQHELCTRGKWDIFPTRPEKHQHAKRAVPIMERTCSKSGRPWLHKNEMCRDENSKSTLETETHPLFSKATLWGQKGTSRDCRWGSFSRLRPTLIPHDPHRASVFSEELAMANWGAADFTRITSFFSCHFQFLMFLPPVREGLQAF